MRFETFLSLVFGLSPIVGAGIGYRWAGLGGVPIGVLIGFSPLLILATAYGVVMLWFPDRPVCMCGNCKSGDYKYRGGSFRKSVYYYQCPFCQQQYRQKEGRFEAKGDKDCVSYMKLSRWGDGRTTSERLMRVSIGPDWCAACFSDRICSGPKQRPK